MAEERLSKLVCRLFCGWERSSASELVTVFWRSFSLGFKRSLLMPTSFVPYQYNGTTPTRMSTARMEERIGMRAGTSLPQFIVSLEDNASDCTLICADYIPLISRIGSKSL